MGMTREKYFQMCEQLGDEPDQEKIPLELEDFPDYVNIGMEIFNVLPDTYTSLGMEGVMYTGKDLSSLSFLAREIFEVEDREELKSVFSIVAYLDTRAREAEQRRVDKKNKGKGKK